MNRRETAAFYEIGAPGIRCRLSPLGAAIAALEVRDARGEFLNIALSPLNFRAMAPDPSLAGRTVGPCCGRVREGEIEIEGRRIQLERNEGSNHLHGGSSGCAQRLWEAERLSPSRVRFRLRLPDGLAGYPGERALSADYEASEDALQVTYAAETDRATWLDLTNHVYFDLSGRFDGAAMRQTLQAAAGCVVRNDRNHLPLVVSLADGAFDFLEPCALADKLAGFPGDMQLTFGRGYNNALLLSGALRRELGFCARLASPDSGIRMTLDTDAPAIVLYTGGFLDGQTRLRDGGATPGCAVALEAQGVPDPFHLPGAAPQILHPGETWSRTIRWSFDRPSPETRTMGTETDDQ